MNYNFITINNNISKPNNNNIFNIAKMLWRGHVIKIYQNMFQMLNVIKRRDSKITEPQRQI